MGNNKTLKPYSDLVKYDNYYTYDNDVHTPATYEPYIPYDKYLTWDTYGVKKVYTPQTTTNFLNYNDPLEINSMADVILTTFNPKMKRGNWGGLEKIPILNIYTGMYELAWKTTFKPLIQGEFGTVALNNLTSIGETTDVVANPVKALVLGEDGQFFTGDELKLSSLLDSLGWSSRGRKNFDADTGFWVTDIATEILLDPMNWPTLGSWAVGKSVISGVKTTVKEVAPELGESMAKKLAKRAVEAFKAGDYATVDEAVRKLAKEYVIKGKLVALKEPTTDEILAGLQKVMDTTLEYKSSEMLDTIQKIVKRTDAVDDFLLKGALTSTGLYPAYKVIQEGGEWVSEAFWKKTASKLAPFSIIHDDGSMTINLMQYEEAKAIFKENIDNYNRAKKYSKSIKDRVFNADTPDYNNSVYFGMVYHSVQVDYLKIVELQHQFGYDYVKFDEALRKYFKITDPNVNPLEVYIAKLEKINAESDGFIDEFIELTQDHLDHYSKMKTASEVSEKLERIKKQKDTAIEANERLKETAHFFSPKQKQVQVPVAQEEVFTPKVQKRINELKDNIEDIENKQKDLKESITDALTERQVSDIEYRIKYLEIQKKKFQEELDGVLNRKVSRRSGVSDLDASLMSDAELKGSNDITGEELANLAKIEALQRKPTIEDAVNDIARQIIKDREAMVLFSNKEFLNPEEALLLKNLQDNFTEEYYINLLLSKIPNLPQLLEIPELAVYIENNPLFIQLKKRYDSILDNAFTSIARGIKDVMEGNSKGFKLNFKPIAFRVNEAEEYLTDYLKGLDNLMPSETEQSIFNSFTTLDRLKAKAASQGKIVDAIKAMTGAKHSKFLNNVQYVKPDLKTVMDIQKKLRDIVGDDIFTFFNSNKDLFNGDPNALAEAVEEFLNLFNDIDGVIEGVEPFSKEWNEAVFNLEKYKSAWENLNNLLTRSINRNNIDTGLKIVDQSAPYQIIKAPSRTALKKHLTDLNNFIVKTVDFTKEENIIVRDAISKLVNIEDYTRKDRKEIIETIKQLANDRPDIFKKYDINNWLTELEAKFKIHFSSSKKGRKGYVEKTLGVSEVMVNKSKVLENTAEQLEELQDLLQAVNPVQIVEGEYDLLHHTTLYALKVEQTMATLELMDEEFTKSIVNDINTNVGVGQVINTIAALDTTDEAVLIAARLKELTAIYTTTLYFQDRLLKMSIPDDVKFTFLSTFMKYQRMDPTKFYQNIESNMKKIFEDVETFMYTKQMKASASISDILDSNNGELRKIVDAKVKDLNLHGHDAMYDVIAQEIICEKYLPDIFADPTKKYVTVDIETTGFEANQGVVFQIGIKERGQEAFTFRKQLTGKGLDVPNKRTLDVFFKNNPELCDADELTKRAKFIEMFSGDLTEKELLQKFMDYLDGLGDNVVILGHNFEAFDSNFIARRLEKNSLIADASRFKEIQMIDTLKLIREKQGYKALSSTEKSRLSVLVESFVESQISAGTRHLFEPVNKDLATNLKALSSIFKDLITGKATLGGKKTTLIEPDYANMLDTASKNINDKLKEIKKTNRLLGDHILDKNYVDNGLYLEDLQALIKVIYTDEKKQAEMLELFSSYLNTTKMMYGLLDEGVYNLGYKKIVDGGIIDEWFNFGNVTKIGARLAQNLTSMGKHLDRARISIVNPELILPYEDEIKAIISTLNTSSTSSILKYFRKDKADILSNFAMLQYAYRWQTRNGGTLFDIDSVSTDLMELIIDKNKRLTTYSFFKDTDVSYVTASSKKMLDSDLVKNTLALKSEYELFKKNCYDSFDKLSYGLDEKDVFRARTQAISSAFKAMVETVEYYTNKISSLTAPKQQRYLETIRRYTNSLAKQQLVQVLNLDEDNLYKLMVHYAPWIEFDRHDLSYELIDKVHSLSDKFSVIDVDDRCYIVLKDAPKIKTEFFREEGKLVHYVGNAIIEKPMLVDLDFAGVQKFNDLELVGHFINTANSMKFLSSGNSVGSLGDAINKSTVSELYDQLPEQVKKELGNLAMLQSDDFFQEAKFNFINLGSTEYRRVKQPFVSSNLVQLNKTSAEMLSAHNLTKLEYISMFHDQGLSIKVGELTDDDALLKALNYSNEYCLAALVKDDKYGCRVTMLRAKTKEDLEIARNLNAVLMTKHSFGKSVEVINTNIMKESHLKFWNRLIYSYKAGYLIYPGVFIRNFLDGTLKNTLSTNESVAEVAKNQVDALYLLNKYNTASSEIIKLSKSKKVPIRVAMEEYFSNTPAIESGMYKLLDDFLKDGPSAGMTKAWQDFFLENRLGSDPETLWNEFVHYSSILMSPNSMVEQINRLAEYLILIKKGYSNTKAFQAIADTHFDYALKTDFEKYLELIFPFYTFSKRNLEYWLDAVDRNPWLMRQIDNFMEPTWNFDSYSKEEYARNRSLQYQITSGNIPLTDSGMTFKFSPSFMDAYNLLTNPVESVKSKLFSPIQAIVNMNFGSEESKLNAQKQFNIWQEFPVIGPLLQKVEQSKTYYDRTGNPLNAILPSVFGATQRWKPYAKKSYPKKTYPKRGRQSRTKYYNQYSFSRKYYSTGYNPNRYFTPKGFGVGYSKGKPKMYNYVNNRNFHSNSGFYKKHYNNKGKSRLKSRMVPVNAYTLKYRIKDYSHY